MDHQPGSSSTRPLNEDSSIFEDSYYKEVQLDTWLHERKKASISLVTIGAIILIGDILARLISNSFTDLTLLIIIVIPAIYFALAYLARFKPMLALILGTAVFGSILAYNFYLLGSTGIFNGWIKKAVIIFIIFKGFRHAKDAENARKNLDLFA